MAVASTLHPDKQKRCVSHNTRQTELKSHMCHNARARNPPRYTHINTCMHSRNVNQKCPPFSSAITYLCICKSVCECVCALVSSRRGAEKSAEAFPLFSQSPCAETPRLPEQHSEETQHSSQSSSAPTLASSSS